MFFGDFDDRIHIRGLTEKVHRNDGTGFRGDLFSDFSRIDIECHRIDIGEYRFGSGTHDRTDRGKKGEWRGDHFVARPDLFRHQGDQKRI